MSREWERREPAHRDVVEEHIFCPTCDKQLDEFYCLNDGDECDCGRWYYSMRLLHEPEESGYYFKRKENEEEIRERLRKRKASLEEELAQIREGLGE